MFDDEDAEKGVRPASLAEPQGPQERVQLRTVEDIADVLPMVQILDIPVLQGVDQLVEVWRYLDFHIPEQVIEVSKILASSCHSRKVLIAPQKAEQWVEVPTIVSFSSLQQRTVEQIIDIPVPGRGGGGERRGLQSLFPGQSTTAQSAQIVDIPVPRGQGFLPGQGSTAFFGAHQPAVEYIAPAPAVFQAPVPVGEYSPLHLRCSACPSQWWSMLHPRRWRFAVLDRVQQRFADMEDLVVDFKTLSRDRVQQRFSEMEDLVVDFKTLSRDNVQQRLVEQMMLKTS